VAPQKYQATLVEIRNIADEIRARGRVHRSSLRLLEEDAASTTLAAQFGLAPGAALFHSVIVHFEDDVALQVEDRWVNPACAPAYLAQDFIAITPSEHLMAVAPLQGATYSIEALPAPAGIAAMLAIDAGELPGPAPPHHVAGTGGVDGDHVASGSAVPVHRNGRIIVLHLEMWEFAQAYRHFVKK
jgi:GntR family histidine utilization transcriptional repressor